MTITRFALKHRTTVFVLIFLLIVVGMVSYLTLPREAAPDIRMPIVVVSVPYPGVSPEDMESLITVPLEAELEDLDDLDEMTSTSSEGLSMVVLTFLPDVDDSEAIQQVRDRVSRARPKLPEDILEPIVKQISSSEWPILNISLHGTAGLVRLKRLPPQKASKARGKFKVLVWKYGATQHEPPPKRDRGNGVRPETVKDDGLL